MGFQLHYFRELSNPGTKDLRTVEFGVPFIFDRNESCPSCQIPLEIVIKLTGDSNALVRIGCCNECGYIGYMDRPSSKWLSDFYLEEWAVNRKEEFKEQKLYPRKKRIIEKAVNLIPDKNIPICEVGSGKGEILGEFHELGYKNICGVENSRRLSELVEANLNVKVFVGSIELEEVTKAVGQRKFVISWHVLEHAFNPQVFISNISKMQGESDLLVLAMPNAEKEPFVNTIFWLPHLHAFTKLSLEKILNKNGYELMSDDSEEEDEIIFFARKTSNPIAKISKGQDYLKYYQNRLNEYFYIRQMEDGKRYCFSWSPKTFKTKVSEVSYSESLDRISLFFERLFYFFSSRLLGIFSNHRSFVYSRIAQNNLPLEVKYKGNIKLLVR